MTIIQLMYSHKSQLKVATGPIPENVFLCTVVANFFYTTDLQNPLLLQHIIKQLQIWKSVLLYEQTNHLLCSS